MTIIDFIPILCILFVMGLVSAYGDDDSFMTHIVKGALLLALVFVILSMVGVI